ncbi:hypothetical protein B0H13DRAFT_1861833 [Mycena leptocephala]|nr:hypothetical protein B0H13DRAFT_1861833 [Mycena leptocephala]
MPARRIRANDLSKVVGFGGTSSTLQDIVFPETSKPFAEAIKAPFLDLASKTRSLPDFVSKFGGSSTKIHTVIRNDYLDKGVEEHDLRPIPHFKLVLIDPFRENEPTFRRNRPRIQPRQELVTVGSSQLSGCCRQPATAFPHLPPIASSTRPPIQLAQSVAVNAPAALNNGAEDFLLNFLTRIRLEKSYLPLLKYGFDEEALCKIMPGFTR